MSEDGEERFREPETVDEERELVEKAIPSSTKYANKWAATIFGKWQISPSVIAPVLDPGGLFKSYDFYKVAQLSTSIEEMDAVTLNYWLSKFAMEVAKKLGEREISTEDRSWNSLWYPTLSRSIISNNILVIFEIVVNYALIIEKYSLKCKSLI